jgi:hypothetical protein
MDLRITKKRLRAWIDLLTAGHIARGKVWYSNANTFAERLGIEYSIPLERAVGVMAVLSVQNRWDVNKRDAEAMIRASYEGRDLDGVTAATYSSQKRKAVAILAARGENIAAMIGTKYAPKTQAFYSNIIEPFASIRVTLDRWIFRGLGLENTGTGGAGNHYIALYHAVETLFQTEAEHLAWRPCELQASVWICIQETADVEQWEGSRPHSGLALADADTVAPF